MERGFSLIELLTVISLIGIAAGLAVPSYRNAVVNNRLAATSNEFVSAINLARSEAIRRRTFVAVRPLSVNNWNAGWEVLTGSGQIQAFQMAEGLSFSEDSETPVAAIVFTATGVRSTIGELTFRASADTEQKYRRCISINAGGAIKVTNENTGCARKS